MDNELNGYVAGAVLLTLFAYFLYKRITKPKTPSSGSGGGRSTGGKQVEK